MFSTFSRSHPEWVCQSERKVYTGLSLIWLKREKGEWTRRRQRGTVLCVRPLSWEAASSACSLEHGRAITPCFRSLRFGTGTFLFERSRSPRISLYFLSPAWGFEEGKSGIGPDPLAEGFGASAGVWLLASGDRLHRAGFLRGQKRCAAHAVCLSGKSRRASSDYCGAGAACEAAIRCCVENGGLVDGVGLFDRDHVAPRLCQRIGGGGCRSASWCDLPDCGVSRCSCFDASLRSVGGIKRGGRAFACAVKCADAPFCLMWGCVCGACGGRRRDVLCSLSLPHPSCWAMCERALLRREP